MSSKFNNAVGPQVRAKKKGPGKLIPLLAAMTMVGSMSASTQFFASSAGNHPSLGSSVAGFYPPWQIVSWALKWHAYYPEAFMRAAGVGIGLSSAGLFALLVAKIIRGNSSEANRYLHGSARWAEQKDIEAAGLCWRRCKSAAIRR